MGPVEKPRTRRMLCGGQQEMGKEGRKRGISLRDWLLGNHPSGIQPPGGPSSFVVLLPASSSFPRGSLRQHVATTAKIKSFEAMPTLGRIPAHEIYPRVEMCSFFQRWGRAP